jgi:pheromone shutdown protein TraB
MENVSSLILIGTVHRDPHGYKKLFHLLSEIKPRIITVEISPYSLSFRAKHVPEIRRILRENLRRMKNEDSLSLKEIISHGAVMSIFCLLKDPFEWQAAKFYAQISNAYLFDIDLSVYAQEKLAYLAELVSLENLKSLYKLPSRSFFKEISAQYAKANHLFHNPPKIWPVTKEILEREFYMAEKIRQIFKSNEGVIFCHIGGWEHLLERPDGKSLFHLLQDLNPQRILLPNN